MSVLVVSQFLKFWDCDLPFLNSFIYTYLVAIEMEWQAFKRTAVDPSLDGVRLPPVSLSLSTPFGVLLFRCAVLRFPGISLKSTDRVLLARLPLTHSLTRSFHPRE